MLLLKSDKCSFFTNSDNWPTDQQPDLQKVSTFPQMGIFGMRNFRMKARKLKLQLTTTTMHFLEIKRNITLLL